MCLFPPRLSACLWNTQCSRPICVLTQPFIVVNTCSGHVVINIGLLMTGTVTWLYESHVLLYYVDRQTHAMFIHGNILAWMHLSRWREFAGLGNIFLGSTWTHHPRRTNFDLNTMMDEVHTFMVTVFRSGNGVFQQDNAIKINHHKVALWGDHC